MNYTHNISNEFKELIKKYEQEYLTKKSEFLPLISHYIRQKIEPYKDKYKDYYDDFRDIVELEFLSIALGHIIMEKILTYMFLYIMEKNEDEIKIKKKLDDLKYAKNFKEAYACLLGYKQLFKKLSKYYGVNLAYTTDQMIKNISFYLDMLRSIIFHLIAKSNYKDDVLSYFDTTGISPNPTDIAKNFYNKFVNKYDMPKDMLERQ